MELTLTRMVPIHYCDGHSYNTIHMRSLILGVLCASKIIVYITIASYIIVIIWWPNFTSFLSLRGDLVHIPSLLVIIATEILYRIAGNFRKVKFSK